MRPEADDPGPSYETLLVRQDEQTQKAALTFGVIGVVVACLFIEVWRVFWHVAPLPVLVSIVGYWQGRSMIKMGYDQRGRALLGRLWQGPACTLLIALTCWIQSRFGLWFVQY